MTDDQYNKLSEMYAKKINECTDKDARIAYLESQLKERDKTIEEFDHTLDILNAIESQKDKEIERLKEHVVKLSSAVRIVMDHFPNEILSDQFGEDHQRWIDAVN